MLAVGDLVHSHHELCGTRNPSGVLPLVGFTSLTNPLQLPLHLLILLVVTIVFAIMTVVFTILTLRRRGKVEFNLPGIVSAIVVGLLVLYVAQFL